MQSRRTPSQKRANDFDMKTFALLITAERNGDTIDHKEKALWKEAAIHLRLVRSCVRQMMHPEDRKETVG
jgi:hypothetical protein